MVIFTAGRVKYMYTYHIYTNQDQSHEFNRSAWSNYTLKKRHKTKRYTYLMGCIYTKPMLKLLIYHSYNSLLQYRLVIIPHIICGRNYWSIPKRQRLHHEVWEWIIITSHTSWASCQIRKIAGCACAGNAGNVFPHYRGLAIPTCITARASRTCRDACRDR